MENHYFCAPVPVKNARKPQWQVDVIRKNGEVLVGTLTIDEENLPPRKNKKKVAWRLPDDPTAIPKFGEHERKRLWELFKSQKKERKKESRLSKRFTSPGSSGELEESSIPTALPEKAASNDPITIVSQRTVAHEDKKAVDGDGTQAPVATRGASSEMALRESQNHLRNEEVRFQSTQGHSSSSDTDMGNTTAPTPPPPPGFNAFHVPPAPAVPPTQPQSTDLPLHATTPAPPGLPTSTQPAIPPSLYFTLDAEKASPTLGASVVPFFLQCVTTSTMEPWLAHSHLTLSQTTLSLGSAQATATTYHDRLRQWQSLTISNRWDCAGCTSQTLPASNSQLLVLTGRTIQKQHECLAYHLALVLTEASDRNFLITNEILSLTALNGVS